MIDVASEIRIRVGDEVMIDALGGMKGTVESMRVISEARTVDEYAGSPGNVVLTIRMGDSVVNKRAAEITLVEALF